MARLRDIPITDSGFEPGAGFTAVTTGQGELLKTVLTANTTMPAIAGGAALAVGKLAGTYPAGAIAHQAAQLNIALQQVDGNVTADTPDIGLGTVIGSGVVSVLGGTATFENILTGQTAADCDGTATLKTVQTALVIEAADAHSVYLNVADTWAADGDATLGVEGTITLFWSKV